MTAEVAILNRQAVALAADSAMTVGGTATPKIYNTVNKLFALSKYHPVGVMVYSSAEIMRVPAETVIKHFRASHLRTDECDTLSEYAARLRHFLDTDLEMFPPEARLENCQSVVRGKVLSIRGALWRRLREHPDRRSLRRHRKLLIEGFRDHLSGLADVVSPSAHFASEVARVLDADLPKSAEALLDPYAPMPAGERNALRDVMTMFLIKPEIAPDIDLPELRGGETGIVVAGFGLREFFPALQAFEFVYAFDGSSKYTGEEYRAIDGTCSAMIYPFAQKDMIITFMQGRSSEFDEACGQAIGEFFDRKDKQILQNMALSRGAKGRQRRDLKNFFDEFVVYFRDQISKWTEEEHVMPTLDTVATLPKEELGVIAEALVNLTIHKRKASPDAETVGPPTDVAVISKGDGLIWLKRKHYFDPKLNPHFAYDYFREDK